jgi:hypothetical protein
MQRLARILILILITMVGLTAAVLRCAAGSACTAAAVPARVAVGRGVLTLADLLVPEACPRLRQAADRVSLGMAPRAGSIRVLDGGEIRRLLQSLAEADLSVKKGSGMQIPERIVVRRAGTMKSCAEIAGFVATATTSPQKVSGPRRWPEALDCAAVPAIPEDTPLELTKSAWNAALLRGEFSVRCARLGECVPFLVWTREEKTQFRLASAPSGVPRLPTTGRNGAARLVKPGQTATLTWDEAGIRIVLPVTCLDAGGLGQFVRVRFKNVARTMRAEVMGDGTLRASL